MESPLQYHHEININNPILCIKLPYPHKKDYKRVIFLYCSSIVLLEELIYFSTESCIKGRSKSPFFNPHKPLSLTLGARQRSHKFLDFIPNYAPQDI